MKWNLFSVSKNHIDWGKGQTFSQRSGRGVTDRASLQSAKKRELTSLIHPQYSVASYVWVNDFGQTKLGQIIW